MTADDVEASGLVWYVAYGSNLLWSRFRCYLVGGSPERSRHRNPGARDRSEPGSVKPVEIPGRVRFAGEFAGWGGGGVAFFDPTAAGVTAGRAYLITLEQLDDRPMLTLTSLAGDLAPTAPSPAYLWTVAAGLRESHGWLPQRVAAYLATLPGVAGQWTTDEIAALAGPRAAPR